ncbi:YciI family protein [Rhodococcoides fascians]|uniref:YciI family protein n=1 Tax=Rhodococcoides fascians TaxID=1828 RepID=UPI0003671B6D|nr:YciI family protein [Rhodococcus fascians]
MRYTLILNNAEPEEGVLDQETIAQMQEAFGAYGRALESAGVLVAAEVLTSSSSARTLSLRTGELQIQDGPFADTKEGVGGVFVIEVPDEDAALMWAERCPGAQYGVLEVRAAATSFVDGAWT